jgi:hypothetical protein
MEYRSELDFDFDVEDRSAVSVHCSVPCLESLTRMEYRSELDFDAEDISAASVHCSVPCFEPLNLLE